MRIIDKMVTLSEAEEFWETYTRMCQNQEDALFCFYTDDSVIYESVPGYRDMIKYGREYIPVAQQLIKTANQRGIKILDSTFHDVKFSEVDGNICISAVRHSNVKNFDSHFSLLIGKTDDDRIVVLEERMEHSIGENQLKYVEVTVDRE
jgi:hypothetical protein